MIRKQHQKWLGFNRTIFGDKDFHGSVQIDEYEEPRGEDEVKAYLFALWVDEGYRQQGIATQLMDAAEAYARESGHEYIYLDWDSREAPKFALDFYIRRGYEEVEFNDTYELLKKKLK